ncbi:hypothetical protein SBF1_9430002 [Candidatus Desulfosporosinus infrequens]|uniref:Uncharacterized protein n=1 Tax=Candidatus Desulfosporosinus infrequens TaxID=2043169 RepID=A0A2U3LY22_9FIRM|nr:hypothetical protein SBF1_9430002 [Candidatus Desulfosporosinus infrequens]
MVTRKPPKLFSRGSNPHVPAKNKLTTKDINDMVGYQFKRMEKINERHQDYSLSGINWYSHEWCS